MKIDCRQISKRFQTKNGIIHALSNISFKTNEQEFLCILGPSGCGKTTLLRIIAGILQPTEGKVIYEGVKDNNKPATALVFQEHGVFPWINVIDNVCFGLETQKISRKDRYGMAMPLIEKMHLAGFTKNYPHQLSSGMKQRVGLARAFVSGAEILLMDEPFASLDAQMRVILQEELLNIQREYRKSVIYITHDIEEAITLADRIILMTARPGQIKQEINVNLSRPRNVNGEHASEFISMRNEIWRQIKEEVDKTTAPLS
ncbi:MAG: ABC transporter ATP-binding protein [Chloroflexi bacterium]|nr:ABC transporter ATP-binding protein [Chloroflexota bacterium]